MNAARVTNKEATKKAREVWAKVIEKEFHDVEGGWMFVGLDGRPIKILSADHASPAAYLRNSTLTQNLLEVRAIVASIATEHFEEWLSIDVDAAAEFAFRSRGFDGIDYNGNLRRESPINPTMAASTGLQRILLRAVLLLFPSPPRRTTRRLSGSRTTH